MPSLAYMLQMSILEDPTEEEGEDEDKLTVKRFDPRPDVTLAMDVCVYVPAG